MFGEEIENIRISIFFILYLFSSCDAIVVWIFSGERGTLMNEFIYVPKIHIVIEIDGEEVERV